MRVFQISGRYFIYVLLCLPKWSGELYNQPRVIDKMLMSSPFLAQTEGEMSRSMWVSCKIYRNGKVFFFLKCTIDLIEHLLYNHFISYMHVAHVIDEKLVFSPFLAQTDEEMSPLKHVFLKISTIVFESTDCIRNTFNFLTASHSQKVHCWSMPTFFFLILNSFCCRTITCFCYLTN